MADDFYLDPEGFRAFTRELRDVGEDLGEAQRQLSEVLLQYRGAWGKDQIGKAFQQKYLQPADQLEEGSGRAARGLVQSAGDAQGLANDLAGLDEDAARWMDSQVEVD
ncbi:hypothetical protein AB0I60_23075 [Actinosynnema sp. NPDC050436]|uniref:hypothetical protein n=1 Tax=Actinosynnema sp. NPDC050436 TaxID=3155659 RepID=UPI0033D45D84